MVTLVKHDLDQQYSVYYSQYTDLHSQWILYQVEQAHHRFRQQRPDIDFGSKPDNLTWFSEHYNIFSLCAGSQFLHGVFIDLRRAIRAHWQLHDLEQPQSLWLQCWANLHSEHERLLAHNHEWPWHGYITVIPQPSRTVFLAEQSVDSQELYHIDNQAGQIYIGPGYRYHAVDYTQSFTGSRLTLGWDLCTTDRLIDHRMGFIPLEF